jgi:hypothetical protein
MPFTFSAATTTVALRMVAAAAIRAGAGGTAVTADWSEELCSGPRDHRLPMAKTLQAKKPSSEKASTPISTASTELELVEDIASGFGAPPNPSGACPAPDGCRAG